MTGKLLLLIVVMMGSVANAGEKSGKVIPLPKLDLETRADNEVAGVRSTPPPAPEMTALVGVYTTLSGFFDYQLNAGACQYIRLDPANGNIHVTYMLSEDSTSISAARRTGYAYSTNGGSSWNNFSQVRVPTRRSGYPSLDLLRGINAGLPVIVNHNVVTTDLVSIAFVDSPPGSGAFAELTPPASVSPGDEPIWPTVAGASDGSLIMNASRSTGLTDHITRTTDFASWSPWVNPTPNALAGIPTISNGTGRVGSLMNTIYANVEGVFMLESTDNGATWPTSGPMIYPATRISGPDTLQAWLGCDVVYNGNNPLVAISEVNIGANEPTDGAQIAFWSQATGIVTAATKQNTPGVIATMNRTQVNQLTMGYPAIGLSGSTIVIVYAAFRAETSAVGFNFSDIYMVQSGNGGTSWTTPVNLTNTPNLDERYASISKWNEPGFANIVWQEDTQPGSAAFTDGAPVSRARQVFLKLTLTDVREGVAVPTRFVLGQNYPNPFNPSTRIPFAVQVSGFTSLKVYDVLGREVVTLVNENLRSGSYEATFDATGFASGVYYYTLKTGDVVGTKKMVVLR